MLRIQTERMGNRTGQGKQSNTEATSMVILALGAASEASAEETIDRPRTELADYRPELGWQLASS